MLIGYVKRATPRERHLERAGEREGGKGLTG